MEKLPKELADALGQKGLVSKEVLDQLYRDTLRADENDAVAEEIRTNPQAAEVAKRALAETPANGTYGRPVNATPVSTAPTNMTRTTTSQSETPVSGQEQQKYQWMKPVLRQSIEPGTRGQENLAPTINPSRVLTGAADVGAASKLEQAESSAEIGNVPETLTALEDGFRMQEQAARIKANAEAQGEAQTANMYQKISSDLETQAQIAAEKRAELARKRDEVLAKQEALVKEYESMTIDPNRLYASRTTGQKVVAGISLALSAIGGGNKAGEAIEAAIDRDIAQQKAELDRKKENIGLRQNLLASVLSVIKDEESAIELTKGILLSNAELKAKQISASTKSKQAQANGLELLGQLSAKKQEAYDKAKEDFAVERQIAATNLVNNNIPVVTNEMIRGLNKETIKNVVPGVGIATGAEEKKDLIKGVEAFKKIDNAVKRILDLREEVGRLGGVLNPEQRARANALQLDIFEGVRKVGGWGSMDASASEQIGKYTPEDPLGLGVGTVRDIILGSDSLKAKLSEFHASQRKGFSNYLKGRLMAQTQATKDMITKDLDSYTLRGGREVK